MSSFSVPASVPAAGGYIERLIFSLTCCFVCQLCRLLLDLSFALVKILMLDGTAADHPSYRRFLTIL